MINMGVGLMMVSGTTMHAVLAVGVVREGRMTIK